VEAFPWHVIDRATGIEKYLSGVRNDLSEMRGLFLMNGGMVFKAGCNHRPPGGDFRR